MNSCDNNHYSTRLVSGILVDADRVLLRLRKNTKEFDRFWSLPVGHVETNETDLAAIKRELLEELGIDAIKITEYCVKIDKVKSIYHQVYKVIHWNGDIENREPELCESLDWFSINQLPQNTTEVTRKILIEMDVF